VNSAVKAKYLHSAKSCKRALALIVGLFNKIRHLKKLNNARVHIRVARWHIFKTKIQIWVNFGRCWYLCPFGLFYGYLAYFVAIWYTYFVAIWHILWLFGIFFSCFGTYVVP
jgi:hypothetical protein